MGRAWIHESPASWDDDKQRIIGASPPGVFPALDGAAAGTVVGGDWWRVEEDGRTVGYGWMDTSWGDAEILLAVDPDVRRGGLGGYVLDQLEAEAGQRGLRYLHNVVPGAHPQPESLTVWLKRRGFVAASEDGTLLRRRVAQSGS